MGAPAEEVCVLAVREFLAQLSMLERETFGDHVSARLLSAQLAARCLTHPRTHTYTVDQLAEYLTVAIAALEAAQAALPTPDGGY